MNSRETIPEEPSCDTCIAACCRAGCALVMTHDEAYKHRRNMTTETVLKPKDYPQITPPFNMEVIDASGQRIPVRSTIPVPARFGFYLLLEDCGNLTPDNRCGVYDERPKACVQYEVGSQACLDARAAFGLDGHEQQVEIGRVLPPQHRTVRFQAN